jgi:hypothetical protein
VLPLNCPLAPVRKEYLEIAVVFGFVEIFAAKLLGQQSK